VEATLVRQTLGKPFFDLFSANLRESSAPPRSGFFAGLTDATGLCPCDPVTPAKGLNAEARRIRGGSLRKKQILIGFLAVLGFLACGTRAVPQLDPSGGRLAISSEPPAFPRELRGAWVATVANIDWPSARGLPAKVQQAEARELIAKAHALGLNALFLQVRPAADALYPSALEPWSEYLTGRQGQAPDPAYDPLAFWIDEAHRSGIELHAWFNPYRVKASVGAQPLADNQLARTHPEWVRSYGDQLWLDPGEAGAAAHVRGVILDVVRRYDLDGIHLDDYFYPYPIKDTDGQPVPFPDQPSWQAYQTAGGTLGRADWRRQNVDGFIERLYREVHQLKPQVRVGISPFGLGRPDRRPPGITGFSQFDELYANAELWLEQGWLDYLAPQLYWKIEAPGQPFQPLLAYWRGQNPQGRHVWPGLFTSRIGASEPWPASEITGEIALARDGAPSQGHVHFSMVALRKDYGGINGLLAAAYREPALVPASPWLAAAAPAAPAPVLSSGPDGVRVRTESRPWLLAVWARYGDRWRCFALPGGDGLLPARSEGKPLGRVWASAVGRTGLESPRVALPGVAP
jgi:uncharacterized lipoprotein YddW (UPF0748 family)